MKQPFTYGVEWSPGKPIQKVPVPQPKPLPPDLDAKRKIGDLLINWFLAEQPRADYVTIVSNSLRLVDELHNIWIARVLTTVNFRKTGPKQHISLVRFCISCEKNKLDYTRDRYRIYHNHVIFI